MFQPQPTPYSPFASYGVGSSIIGFRPFAPSGVEVGDSVQGVVDSGGPTVFRDPIFTPVGTTTTTTNGTANASASSLNYNSNPLGQRFHKMERNDIEEQEALAREFQPSLEVCFVLQ